VDKPISGRAPGAQPKNRPFPPRYPSNAPQQVKTQQLFNPPAREYQKSQKTLGIEA